MNQKPMSAALRLAKARACFIRAAEALEPPQRVSSAIAAAVLGLIHISRLETAQRAAEHWNKLIDAAHIKRGG